MADEVADADLAPRDGDERTDRAVQAMVNGLGLDRDLVFKTLKRLYKVRSPSNSSGYAINNLRNIVLGSSCKVENLNYVFHE